MKRKIGLHVIEVEVPEGGDMAAAAMEAAEQAISNHFAGQKRTIDEGINGSGVLIERFRNAVIAANRGDMEPAEQVRELAIRLLQHAPNANRLTGMALKCLLDGLRAGVSAQVVNLAQRKADIDREEREAKKAAAEQIESLLRRPQAAEAATAG